MYSGDIAPYFIYYPPGHISVRNADYTTIRKMLQIAEALQAKVQGDDGELYDTETLNQMEENENDYKKIREAQQQLKSTKTKNWWQFWK